MRRGGATDWGHDVPESAQGVSQVGEVCGVKTQGHTMQTVRYAMATKCRRCGGKRGHPLSDLARRYLDMAQSLWRAASKCDPDISLLKKREALGYALLAARAEAEDENASGGSLAECLRRAAQVLLDEAGKEEER